jgi:N-6 DNA Methylase
MQTARRRVLSYSCKISTFDLESELIVLTSIETVIRDAQAIIANKHTSSSDLIVTTIKVLAQLFFLKYYEQHRQPARLSPAAMQEINEYKNNLDTILDQINLSDEEYQRLLHLVDTLLPPEQPSTHRDDEISHFYSSLLVILTPHNKATGIYPTPQPIARFMAKIIDPKPTDIKIYDPAWALAVYWLPLTQIRLNLKRKCCNNDHNRTTCSGTAAGRLVQKTYCRSGVAL